MIKKSPISKRLKEARLEANTSQKQLGIAAGVHEFVASARLNQYETGKHIPDIGTVQKIAAVLKIPPAYFYTSDDQLAELIKVYGKCSKSEQVKVARFIKKLTE